MKVSPSTKQVRDMFFSVYVFHCSVHTVVQNATAFAQCYGIMADRKSCTVCNRMAYVCGVVRSSADKTNFAIKKKCLT